MQEPRLRHVDKITPPYPLGQFPRGVLLKVAGHIVYMLHTRSSLQIEGEDWESIFADSIGATWKPSNIGLDDVVLGGCCWGAKTVKNTHPVTAKSVRLISGRNSLDFSFRIGNVRELEPAEVGKKVLDIWNSRVSSIKMHCAHTRTVVLVKGPNLSEFAIFEFETRRYDPFQFSWRWNKRDNLQGYDHNKKHVFTWQPHGSQFTIIESIPDSRVAFRIQAPAKIDPVTALRNLGFDESWIEIL